MIDIFIRDINGKRFRRHFLGETQFIEYDWSWFDDETYEIQAVVWYGHCIYNSLVNDKINFEDLRGFFA